MSKGSGSENAFTGFFSLFEQRQERFGRLGGARYMCALSQEALRITAELNNAYHTPEELRVIFSRLTGRPTDDTFTLFPPFYTDCGKNLVIGKNVFYQQRLQGAGSGRN